MPSIRIPGIGVVVTGHRSPEAKRRGTSRKDLITDRLGPANTPRSEGEPRPRIELRAVTPYTRHPTAASVNRGLDRLPAFANDAALIESLRRSLASRAALPRLALIGERHGRRHALLAAAASIIWLSAAPGRKVLLVEAMPDEVVSLGLSDMDSPEMQDTLLRLFRRRPPIDLHGVRDARQRSRDYNMWTLCALALDKGFEVRGFDPDHENARDLDEREDRMFGNVMASVHDAEVTLVLTGEPHVARFHEPLSPLVDTWTVCPGIDRVDAGASTAIKRLSYLLARRDRQMLLGQTPRNATPRWTRGADFPALLDLLDTIGPLHAGS